MTQSVCLDCDRPLLIAATLEIGDTITCRHCQTELELISIDPLKVDWPHDSTYDNWDGDVEEKDEWFDDEDDDEWFDDEDEDYSWMLSKQKRHQEPDELDLRRPPRPSFPGGNAQRPAPRRVDTRRGNDSRASGSH